MTDDGRADFDFIVGGWRIRNRKLVDMTDRTGTDWVEFDAVTEGAALLGGLGNMDRFRVADLPGRGPFEGFSVRLFDPADRLWRIWWGSTARPGRLDVPVEGRFADGVGHFYCEDVVGGQPVRVRFEYRNPAPTVARWEQAFSYDGGATWEVNWVMDWSRD
ncbi:hypothetical protein R8Z50_24235 [Longispora sp. K20-0274]|uniref:hypothetical protein n=1 Tax=Longispora sp. K20-0274 TaxID=3088255 RepID=UPI00399A3B93